MCTRIVRCDSAEKPGKRCTNCVNSRSECTHDFVAQKKDRSFRSGLFTSDDFAQTPTLAQLRESMDPLLKKIVSGSFPVSPNVTLLRETMSHLARYTRALEAVVPEDALGKQAAIPPLAKNLAHTLQESGSTGIGATMASIPDPLGNVYLTGPEQQAALVHDFKRSLTLTDAGDRFFGPSSMSALVDATAMELKEASQKQLPTGSGAITMKKHMRPEFWSILPWELPPPPIKNPLDFPPPDLLKDLVDIYFVYVNTYCPFIHRPTFEKALQDGLHHSDPEFGMVVLGVCAVAARYSDDPRVILEGTSSLHSNGFKWFRQIEIFHEASQRAPSLYDLQTLYLSITYRQGSSTPDSCWYLIAYGIRAAQDIGLNRRKPGMKPTVENELRKRVFWMFILADSFVSAAVGRPPAVELSDLDLELPIDCDDEYWINSDPDLAFKQPAGIPSRVSFLRSMIQLMKIHQVVQRAFKAAFMSGVMLILNVWRSRNSGIRLVDEEREMKAVMTCIDVLKQHEARWHAAGRFRDILATLASAGLPPQPTSPPRAKRPRNEEPETDYPNQEVMTWHTISPPSLTESGTKPSQTMEFSRLRDPPAPTFIQALISGSESPPPYSTLSTDTIPLYVSDLSKPFPTFNQLDGEHSLAWKRQLDELDALWGEGAGDEDSQGRISAHLSPSSFVSAGLSAHSMVANPSIFTTSTGPNDLIGTSSRGPALSTFPPSDTYSFDPGSDLLGIQDATLWSDFPMGHR
ncbi:hypothetical protein MD484_g4430, partial [Candolleomyces efflorescens]